MLVPGRPVTARVDCLIRTSCMQQPGPSRAEKERARQKERKREKRRLLRRRDRAEAREEREASRPDATPEDDVPPAAEPTTPPCSPVVASEAPSSPAPPHIRFRPSSAPTPESPRMKSVVVRPSPPAVKPSEPFSKCSGIVNGRWCLDCRARRRPIHWSTRHPDGTVTFTPPSSPKSSPPASNPVESKKTEEKGGASPEDFLQLDTSDIDAPRSVKKHTGQSSLSVLAEAARSPRATSPRPRRVRFHVSDDEPRDRSSERRRSLRELNRRPRRPSRRSIRRALF